MEKGAPAKENGLGVEHSIQPWSFSLETRRVSPLPSVREANSAREPGERRVRARVREDRPALNEPKPI